MEFPNPNPHPHAVGYTTPVCNAAEVDQGHGLEPGAVAAEVHLTRTLYLF